MGIKRCNILDLPEILDIIGDETDIVLFAKIKYPNYFAFINEEGTAVYIFEFVSGDICFTHTYSKKEGRGRSFLRGAKEAEEWMIENTPCRKTFAMAEGMDNDMQVRVVINHIGGEKVHSFKDGRSLYVKEYIGKENI